MASSVCWQSMSRCSSRWSSCVEQFASEPSPCVRFSADFCQKTKDIFVWTAVSATEDSLFCTIEMDALLLLLEACILLKSGLSYLNFVIVCFLMKLFNTNNTDTVNNCQHYFDVKLPSIRWSYRVSRFEKKFAECDTIFFAKFHFQFDSLHLSFS